MKITLNSSKIKPKLRIGKFKFSCGYVTVAMLCMAVILCRNDRYIIAALCIICHELGHIIMILHFGSSEINIKINLIDIVISDRMKENRSYKQDIAVILAGPMANLIISLVFGTAYFIYKYNYFYDFAVISGILCVFNLLPMETTDGGQLVEIFLKNHFSLKTVQTVMTVLTAVFILPVSFAGFYVLLNSRSNYTLLFYGMYFLFLLMSKIIDNDNSLVKIKS